MPEWYIGCSGFHYKEWKEVFYPKGIPQTKWFECYCQHFNTIELNTTFYRFQQPDALLVWHKKSPAAFKFSVKGPRLISHYKMFIDCERLLGDFYAAIYEGLGDKLGCVLFQLPKRLLYSEDVLNRIIESLDASFDNVVEFRDKSWWNKKVYTALKKNKISLCGISHPTLQDDVIKNNSILYYRFHGVPVLYKSEYKIKFIKEIADEIKTCGRFKEAYYFNNTRGTGAITKGRQLIEYLK